MSGVLVAEDPGDSPAASEGTPGPEGAARAAGGPDPQRGQFPKQ